MPDENPGSSRTREEELEVDTVDSNDDKPKGFKPGSLDALFADMQDDIAQLFGPPEPPSN